MTDPTRQNMNQTQPLLKGNDSMWDYGSARDFSAASKANLTFKSEEFINRPISRGKPQQVYETQQFSVKYFDTDHQSGPISTFSSKNNETLSSQMMSAQGSSPNQQVQRGSNEWIPDAQAPFCAQCHKAFNWRFRRHHCRICGKVFCNKCSLNSEITVNGERKKMIVCKKDLVLHNQLNDQLNKQKLLLRDQISTYERQIDTNQFLENNDFEDNTERRDSKRRQSQSQSSDLKFKLHLANSHDQLRFAEQLSPSEGDTNNHRNSQSRKSSMFNFKETKPHEPSPSTSVGLAQKSTSNKQAMDKYLHQLVAEENSLPIFGDQTMQTSVIFDRSLDRQRAEPSATTKNETLRDSMKTWIDKKLVMHIQRMIDQIIKDFAIDSSKWRRLMIKSTQNAVQTIRPSSRLLNDSIDFNSFIKIITLEYPNQDKCQYVNGVVFKKDVAHRRMLTEIENPRVLVLANSLGYVQDDKALVDLSEEINQENYNMQIVMGKIQSVNPHIIFVEHEASRLALETLFKDQRTVVTNVHPKMMQMIARQTQTIICPSTNLIDKNFVLGNCLKFRVEHILPMTQNKNNSALIQSTSLMYLEGCQSKLGCSIVISGPDMNELRQVKHALRKCLKTARVLMLEREYLRFIRPDPVPYLIEERQVQEEQKQVEPERAFLTFEILEEEKEESLRAQQLKSAEAWNRKQDPEFQKLDSPYLYDKEMKRDFLVFEYFSLSVPSQKDLLQQENAENELAFSDADASQQIGTEGNSILETTMRRNTQTQYHNFLSSELRPVDESSVRQRLRHMCGGKPQKQLVKFYDEETDISLYQMIKKMATSTLQVCEAAHCKKIRLLHTDYYYHNNGCVEIKCREDPTNQDAQKSPLTAEDDYPIFVFCFCNQCKVLVVNKVEVPPQMLEMSFYKLLEQFFYNQTITCFGHQSSIFDANCTHPFHLSCSMIFCYGPIKIMLSFERLEEYVIDLQHFGSSPGIFSQQELRERALTKFGDMQRDFQSSFFFIEDKANLLLDWLKLAAEEFQVFIGPAILPFINNMSAYLEDLIKEISNRKELFNRELFNTEPETNPLYIVEEDPSPKRTQSAVGNKSRVQGQIVSEMQANRILMHVGKRFSELLFALRRLNALIVQKFIPKIFGKRNPFVQHQEQVNKLINQNHFSQSDDQFRIGSTQNYIKDSTQILSRNGSISQKNPLTQTQVEPRVVNMTSSEILPSVPVDLNGPSKRIKDAYVEIADFDNQLQKFASAANLVAFANSLDCGYDDNKVSIDEQDIGSIIAHVLNSNLYITGLAKIEYMQIQQNIKTFRQRVSDLNKNSTDFQLKHFRSNEKDTKMMISPDILNDQITMNMAESELLRENNNYRFVISGSTFCPLEMHIFSGDFEIAHLTEDEKSPEKRYYTQRFEEALDMTFLEEPLPESYFKRLLTLEHSVEKVKVQHQTRIVVKKQPATSAALLQSQEEIDFAALALTGATLTLAKSHHQKDASRSERQPAKTKEENDQKINIVIKIQEGEEQNEVMDPTNMLSLNDIHTEIHHLFHKSLDFSVKIYFPNQFEALRKVYCGSYTDFLHSIYRSEIWKDNSGGKTKSPFLKSHDHKYVIKVVKNSEVRMFESMGDNYFEYMCRSFTQQCPTALSKILGIFRIRTRQGVYGKVNQTYCILMENLLLGVDENVAIKYDLKGSERNRYVPIASRKQVALDTNFLYDMRSRPIPLQFQMRKMLQIAIANDSIFLSQHQVIDYSLLLIIDPVKKTLRIGIIDYIQQYTIEKELESYVKQAVSKVVPTIIGPDLYKQRFRNAMDKYFIGLIPDEECKFSKVINERFNAKKIHWFTKELDLYLTNKDLSQNVSQTAQSGRYGNQNNFAE